MARTDHVHPSAIQVTSNALLLVTQMEMDLGKVLTFIEAGQRPPIEVAAQIAWYEGYFDGLIQAYDASMRGVQQALDEGGDVLPIRNYAAWHVLKANSLNE